MLGAIINNVTDEFLSEKADNITMFIRKLTKLNIHPQLAWTILRLCGAPKLIYLACTMPPNQSSKLLEFFDTSVLQGLQEILKAEISSAFAYDTLGCGFPCYSISCALAKARAQTVLTAFHPSGAFPTC
jgi:hypothetical protein